MTRYLLTGLMAAALSTWLLSNSVSADHRSCDYGYSIRSYSAAPAAASGVQRLSSVRYYYPQTYYYSYGVPYYLGHHHHHYGHHHSGVRLSIGVGHHGYGHHGYGGHYGGHHFGGHHFGGHHFGGHHFGHH